MNPRTRHKLMIAPGVRPGADPEIDAMELAGWLRRVKSFHPRHYGGNRPRSVHELVEVFTLTTAGEDALAGEAPTA